jgi:glycosyltransferase involved in cell wall biosynthesis
MSEVDVFDFPLVNVLTRTSGRPKFFKENAESVHGQTYKNLRHIVSVDDETTLKYVLDYHDSEWVRVLHEDKKKQYGIWHSPYNLYCNDLMDHVDGGWIMFLDDDDLFSEPMAVERIVNCIRNEDDLLIWKTQFADKVLPDRSFGLQVARYEFPSFCFMFHSKHKWAAQWDEVKESDYRVGVKLETILNPLWIDYVFTRINYKEDLGSGGGFGNGKDK